MNVNISHCLYVICVILIVIEVGCVAATIIDDQRDLIIRRNAPY